LFGLGAKITIVGLKIRMGAASFFGNRKSLRAWAAAQGTDGGK
jgi:hypothetical protein